MSTSSQAIGPFVVGEKPAPLIYTYADAAGQPIDLTGYTVKFSYREHFGSYTTVDAVLLDGPTGQVQYVWAGTEFPTAGHYTAQFWVGNGSNRFASIYLTFDVASPVGLVPAI